MVFYLGSLFGSIKRSFLIGRGLSPAILLNGFTTAVLNMVLRWHYRFQLSSLARSTAERSQTVYLSTSCELAYLIWWGVTRMQLNKYLGTWLYYNFMRPCDCLYPTCCATARWQALSKYCLATRVSTLCFAAWELIDIQGSWKELLHQRQP